MTFIAEDLAVTTNPDGKRLQTIASRLRKHLQKIAGRRGWHRRLSTSWTWVMSGAACASQVKQAMPTKAISSQRQIFPERLYLEGPRGLNRALDELDSKQRTTRSELIRCSLMRQILDAGVLLNEPDGASHG